MRRIAPLILAVLALAGCGGHTPQSATGFHHPPGWGGTPKGVTLPAPERFTATPTATMFDAVTVGNIPHGPFAVAGYPFGNFITWGSLLRDFPGAHHVSVAVQASQRAMCLDVEPGDATPGQAGPWVRADMAAGFRVPCEYGDLSNMPAIEASDRASLGADWRAHVLLWLAWYRNVPGLVSGYDAVQYTESCLGRNLDCDTVSLRFLAIASPPYVPAPVLPVCIHHRESRSDCAAAKRRIAGDQRAAGDSRSAYVARGCPVLSQRVSWYQGQLKRHPKVKTASRRRALALSRAAFRQRSCTVFNQRAVYFSAAAAHLGAVN